MTIQTDRYSRTRKPDHSTLGDSIERYNRDADAFQAGAQYALDKITNVVDRVLMDPNTSEYLTEISANILVSFAGNAGNVEVFTHRIFHSSYPLTKPVV